MSSAERLRSLGIVPVPSARPLPPLLGAMVSAERDAHAELCERLAEATSDVAECEQAVAEARKQDRRAGVEAARAGSPLPADEHTLAARARLVDAQRVQDALHTAASESLSELMAAAAGKAGESLAIAAQTRDKKFEKAVAAIDAALEQLSRRPT